MGETAGKMFNVNGDCKPGLHCMVDLNGRLEKFGIWWIRGRFLCRIAG